MAWTNSNPVSIGDPTKKAHYDTLWDNADFVYTFVNDCNLTANRVLTGNGTSPIVAESVLFYDGTNMGVGTASPDGTLHVHTGSAGSMSAHTSADNLIVEIDGTGGLSILTPSSGVGTIYFGSPYNSDQGKIRYDHNDDTMQLYTADTDRITVNGSGQVGINQSSPDGTLHVHTATAGSVAAQNEADDLVIENSSDGGMSILTPSSSVGTIYFGSPYNNDQGKIRYDHNDDTMQLYTADTDRITVNGSGQVGINQSAPDGTLHVHAGSAGSVAAHSSADNLIVEIDGTGGMSILTPSSSVGTIYFGSPYNNDQGKIRYDHNDDTMQLYTADTDRITVNGSGQVGINQSAPDGTLHVHTATAGSVTANTNADDLIIENSGNVGISLLCPTDGIGYIMFGDPDDNNIGYISYVHLLDSNAMVFSVNNNSDSLRINSDSQVGIRTASIDGTLHVWTSSAGSVSAHSSGDDLVVENNTTGGISILTPSSASGTIYYGGPHNNDDAYVSYDHSIQTMKIGTAGDTRVYIDSNGQMLINETANTKSIIGLTINQGANDDEIFALKSSDVAHGVTTVTETDTYMYLKKKDADEGGVALGAFTEGDEAFHMQGVVTTTNTIAASTTSAPIILSASLKDGTSTTSLSADDNVMLVNNSASCCMIVKGDGDLLLDASLTENAFDKYHDAIACSDLSYNLSGELERVLAYNKERLNEMGVINHTVHPDGKEDIFVSTKKMTMLQLGAIGELYKVVDKLAEKLGTSYTNEVRKLGRGDNLES